MAEVPVRKEHPLERGVSHRGDFAEVGVVVKKRGRRSGPRGTVLVQRDRLAVVVNALDLVIALHQQHGPVLPARGRKASSIATALAEMAPGLKSQPERRATSQ